ncbi:hypothetical protein C8Q75DRAFT_157582 [Abortiporus biennis]|nr:hypothetical protein C8Q75DRAFT_157582 [Abortiporus biennis]
MLVDEIYADELGQEGFGHPLWLPTPYYYRRGIQVGDVGVIVDGQFRYIYNVSTRVINPPPSTSSFSIYDFQACGLPLTYPKLNIDDSERIEVEDFVPRITHSKSVKVESVNSKNEVTFSCSTGRGAILYTAKPGKFAGVRPSLKLRNHVRDNHMIWSDFVRKSPSLCLKSKPEDVLLVRGFTTTTEFIAGVVAPKSQERVLDGSWGNPGMNVIPDGLKFLKQENQVVRFRIHYIGISPSSFFGNHDIYDQENCNGERHIEAETDDEGEFKSFPRGPMYIFINYYQVRYRCYVPTIFANAEPKDPSLPPHDGDNAGELKFQTWKPLDELLNHLLRKSTADMAIACDDDVFTICKGPPWPKDFQEFYERVSPRIYVDDHNVVSLYREEYLPDGHQERTAATTPLVESAFIKTTFNLDVTTISALRELLLANTHLSSTSQRLSAHKKSILSLCCFPSHSL